MVLKLILIINNIINSTATLLSEECRLSKMCSYLYIVRSATILCTIKFKNELQVVTYMPLETHLNINVMSCVWANGFQNEMKLTLNYS